MFNIHESNGYASVVLLDFLFGKVRELLVWINRHEGRANVRVHDVRLNSFFSNLPMSRKPIYISRYLQYMSIPLPQVVCDLVLGDF